MSQKPKSPPKQYRVKTTAKRDHWNKARCGGMKAGEVMIGATLLSHYEAKKNCKFMTEHNGAFCSYEPVLAETESAK